MKYSACSVVCGWILLASAKVYPVCGIMEDEQTGPVVVSFKMVRCGGFKDQRCPSFRVRMSADAYDLLERPEKVKWFYTVTHVKNCSYPQGGTFLPICKYRDVYRTDRADIVYDQENNEYFLEKQGASFVRGIGFRLNSVCLSKGNGEDYAESCEQLSRLGNRSGADYDTGTACFSPPVREEAASEIGIMYMPVLLRMPFQFYPALAIFY